MAQDDDSRVSRRCVVSGEVQGVWFRASTRDKARELGVSGEARNLPDGTVEVLMTGPQEGVDALCDWLWQGPPKARVSAVDCQSTAVTDYSGFSTA